MMTELNPKPYQISVTATRDFFKKPFRLLPESCGRFSGLVINGI